MALLRRLAALGVAAEAARRYARNHPDKARELTDKAASFLDQQTKRRYSGQIGSVKERLAEYGGFAAPHPVPGTSDVTVITPRPTPRRRAT